MGKANNFCFTFSSVFAFKQGKEHILFQVQPLKSKYNFVVLILGLQAKFSKATKVGNSNKGNIFELGSYNKLANLGMCPILFLQKSFPPTVHWLHSMYIKSAF